MSFLNYQKQSPEILNNYLKYKTFILNESNTTSNEEYFDLRTLFRFIRLYIHDRNKLNTITKEEFKSIDIADIELDDFSKLSRFDIEQYIIFLKNTLENKLARLIIAGEINYGSHVTIDGVDDEIIIKSE